MGSSLDFAPSNTSYISTGETVSHNITSDMSVCAWVNIDAQEFRSFCSNKDTSSFVGWAFGMMDDGDLRFSKWGKAHIDSNLNISTGSWHFAAAVCDEDTDVKFYLDDSTNTVNDTNTFVSSTGEFVIGHSQAGINGNKYNGKLAHLHVYTGLLKDEEVAELRWKPGSIRRNLLSYWPMMESISPSYDLSGNGYSGTWGSGVSVYNEGPPIQYGKLL